MKKIICFGDSVTEMGTVLELKGYVAQLADRYVRRADVLARGFSGYNTREALRLLKPAVLDEHPDVVIVMFGANDSVLCDQIQHVPLQEYCENLQKIASDIACVGAWLILVTPPPVSEVKTRSRTLDHTGQYARACYELGLEMNLPVIDMFHRIQEEADWEKKCMIDGIHLSAQGMEMLYEEICRHLDKIFPLSHIERLGVDGI
jgi:lysophospholipase L1-like esterase